jgi:hypothetical protein
VITTFFGIGFIIGTVTGNTASADGSMAFSLSGWPALAFFALLIAYFVGLGRYGGGTIWQRILRTK